MEETPYLDKKTRGSGAVVIKNRQNTSNSLKTTGNARLTLSVKKQDLIIP